MYNGKKFGKERDKMEILSVYDPEFKRYGTVLEGFDYSELFKVCKAVSPKPLNSFTYTASVPEMETLRVAKDIENHVFGGMPVQFGFCNGSNHTMNCLEFHRTSELNIAIDSVILLLGCVADFEENYKLNTDTVKAFKVPAGVGVELFGTTLHYAPCNVEEDGYRVICVLPRGTNGERPEMANINAEDKLCMGTNKWLVAHNDAPEAVNGAYVGLYGKNLTV